MIRMSEMVLPGHPDKFCDQIADAIVAECYRADPQAYCQVEVSVWSEDVWLTGGTMTRGALERSLEQIVKDVGREIGYVAGNAIDAERYIVRSSVCLEHGDPRRWTEHVNDQSIVVGWAGYDAKTRYLAPEHFLAHAMREALTESCRVGRLQGHGPDGKLLVRMREEGEHWIVEHLLVTLQHPSNVELFDMCKSVSLVLEESYEALRRRDRRWSARWTEIDLLVNPNGPLLSGGSDGDNGQTGRKLTMDFYGPRIGIGGGALSGKDLSHIDRAGAIAARQAAVAAVRTGARECRVVSSYAPNLDEPLEVVYEMNGAGDRRSHTWFAHSAIRKRVALPFPDPNPGRGLHFWHAGYAWNAIH